MGPIMQLKLAIALANMFASDINDVSSSPISIGVIDKFACKESIQNDYSYYDGEY
jgi:hypothetical protein